MGRPQEEELQKKAEEDRKAGRSLVASLRGKVLPLQHHTLNTPLMPPDSQPTNRLVAGDFPLLRQKHLSFYPFLLSSSGRRLIEGFYFHF